MSETAAAARPGPRRTRSEAELVDAARTLVARSGPAALSIRAVAAEVGVTANAVYTYFPTKAALEAAVVESVLAEADLGALEEPGLDWRERLLRVGLALRETLVRHRGAVPLLLASPFTGPTSLDLGERTLRVLVDGGFAPGVAARASYALITSVLGNLAAYAAEVPPGDDVPEEDALAAERLAALQRIPAAAFPLTAATAAVTARFNGEEQYRWGVELLLDGLAAQLPR
ncbi:TetR/AcrR family transcriptional regulator C-terminal domain-containing protein [uncultured Amnibacterium sp.]|uniref:TetR/AcrR family transcriptional regulator C-terminal domain-containing protein n=1 Tax=uncultured Amnibacterium sp. TaxID=1631851 RepID=UPI0035CBCC5B